jgi:hypothetical protein
MQVAVRGRLGFIESRLAAELRCSPDLPGKSRGEED